eukprot:scaffold104897_cov72-Phaeocystis_antarctica.AAC.8
MRCQGDHPQSWLLWPLDVYISLAGMSEETSQQPARALAAQLALARTVAAAGATTTFAAAAAAAPTVYASLQWVDPGATGVGVAALVTGPVVEARLLAHLDRHGGHGAARLRARDDRRLAKHHEGGAARQRPQHCLLRKSLGPTLVALPCSE